MCVHEFACVYAVYHVTGMQMSASWSVAVIGIRGQHSHHGEEMHTNHCSRGSSGFESLALSGLHQAHTAYTYVGHGYFRSHGQIDHTISDHEQVAGSITM